MNRFQHYRMLCSKLYGAVKEGHEASTRNHYGHGLDHDVAVAMMAASLVEDMQLGALQARKAFAAGLLHSTDRVFGPGYEEVLERYLLLLPNPPFRATDAEEIRVAVLRHDEFKDKNVDTRSTTQRILMDADKLVNMDPLLIVRSGQHHPNIPAIELEYIGRRNPASTFKEPTSVIEDLWGSIEWVEPGWFHYPEAQRRAEVLAEYIRTYIKSVEQEYEALGIAGLAL